ARLHEREVQVSMPKFKLTAEFQLGDTLGALGMPSAFQLKKADFTGITGQARKRLAIQEVVHKAYVDVNEEGTEAAAATGVVGIVPVSLEDPPAFRADHPFLFLIRDVRTGSILFMGRLSEPPAKG